MPVGVLVAGCLIGGYLSVEPEEAKKPSAQLQTLRTRVLELSIGDYPVVVTTHGIVQAHNAVTLSAEVAGLITRTSGSFEAGAYFSEGDVLVELDARDYITAVEVAKARVTTADAAQKLAEQNHNRNLELVKNKGVSEAGVDLTAALLAQAAAEAEAAAAQLKQAQRDLERTKIRAPFDGRVRTKGVGIGQLVNMGAVLGEIFAVDFAEVRLPIAAAELQFLVLPELAGESPIDVVLRDPLLESSNASWRAQIVRTEGVLDQNSLELYAIARIDDPFGLRSGDPPLRIGQPVEASISGKVLTDVVALPRAAVRQLNQITLVDKEKLTLTSMRVTPLWTDDEHVVVRESAIGDGAWLSTTDLVFAPNGAKVDIISDVDLASTVAQPNREGRSE